MDNQKKGCLCWSESIKVSVIIGILSTLLTVVAFDHLIKIQSTVELVVYIFLGSTIVSLIATRIGWINKGKCS